MRIRGVAPIFAAIVGGAAAVSPLANAGDSDDHRQKHREHLKDFKHIVVIYQENHSFDNLYGLWGDVNEDSINGLSDARSSRTVQVRQDNQTSYKCLLQNDVNL